MKLTQFLLKRKYPRGSLFRGKYRLVKRVEPLHIAAIRNDMMREEENMLYLRHPYVQEQEYKAAFGNEREVRQAEFNEKYRKIIEERLGKWQHTVKDRTLEANLMNLRKTECWD